MRRRNPLTAQAYEEIKRRILTLALPPGTRIDDYKLAEELDLSRTPVREALVRLAGEGLVTVGQGRSGFSVHALDISDIADIIQTHIVLAKAVARLTAHRATDAEIEHLRVAAGVVDAAIEREDFLEITNTNARFHQQETAAAHSGHLRRLVDGIFDQEQRLSYLCFGGMVRDAVDVSARLKAVHDDHHALVAAYERHDAPEAERIATEHIVMFGERVQEYLSSSWAVLSDLSFPELDPAENEREPATPA